MIVVYILIGSLIITLTNLLIVSNIEDLLGEKYLPPEDLVKNITILSIIPIFNVAYLLALIIVPIIIFLDDKYKSGSINNFFRIKNWFNQNGSKSDN